MGKSLSCNRRVTHAAPNVASMRGLRAAIDVLHADATAMGSDEATQAQHALAQAPYCKRQGDLGLAIAEDDRQ